MNTVDLKSTAFATAVHEHGWARTKLSVAAGRNSQYLRQAIANRRINYQTLLEMCEILHVDPNDFIGREDYIPLEVSTEPIVLDTEGTVALFTAIVTRAKEDYILAYLDKLSGKCKRRDGHVSLGLETIEWELGSEWFKDHLVGAVTTNKKAVDTMVSNLRREAKRIYDMTIRDARDWVNPATTADKFREACAKKGEVEAQKELTRALMIACQCMSKVIAWEDDCK